ncbi:MAG: hydantoinase B/oxoprolinase family protein, partial [Verrucomicrobia bacterium]|nr:hydantoinase B/oxoprolinase family protein [Verrucomicrobiota bacterium]
LNDGDVIITNHPAYGGSHLPDVTVICPVFSDTKELLGFLVNRAHHAEIGGISPGSMPPAAASLAEEGVVIPPISIMRNGQVDLNGVESLLRGGAFPSRRVRENLADLKAQVAANLKGLEELLSLVREHGRAVVCQYMADIQNRAERSLRRKLAGQADGCYEGEQRLDDGTVLKVVGTISGETLRLSFSDGGGVHTGNFNATPGIVYSAVIYFLRVWLNEPMPLNEGLLRPVKIELPPGLLNPPFSDDPYKCPPVVAGNVETSQRLVDTLLLAFEVVACSQGTMNNLIFGNDRISFYETIAGGAGAGDGFAGESGVHVHMTNTGITDPEILEYRFPVKLREFSIRRGSGGDGEFPGGDGLVRELEFTEPVTLSLLTQHRVESPYGLKGGQPGKTGEQWLFRKDEKPVCLAPTVRLEIQAGDRLRILTPGGGGWGTAL